MQWYVNDLSLQGQFADLAAFEDTLRDLVRVRTRIESLRTQLRTPRSFPERYVRADRSLRHVIQELRDIDLRRAVFSWLDRTGPFVDDDRLPEMDDYFECLNLDVTDSGLGEAARRTKNGDRASCFSFPGGPAPTDFAFSPLHVIHGLPEEPLGTFDIVNYWRVRDLEDSARENRPPASSWRELVEVARDSCPRLLIPDRVYENPMLSREPFDAAVRDRALQLLRYLDRYMAGRDAQGAEGPDARFVIDNFFRGERALFTGESVRNEREFASDLTFSDPECPDRSIFAPWHGKISRRFFRLHFEWPVPARAPRLKVLYLGPKLTKN